MDGWKESGEVRVKNGVCGSILRIDVSDPINEIQTGEAAGTARQSAAEPLEWRSLCSTPSSGQVPILILVYSLWRVTCSECSIATTTIVDISSYLSLYASLVPTPTPTFTPAVLAFFTKGVRSISFSLSFFLHP